MMQLMHCDSDKLVSDMSVMYSACCLLAYANSNSELW